ncbi:MAG: glycosyltransferase family 2 protein [Propylenella sp.]
MSPWKPRFGAREIFRPEFVAERKDVESVSGWLCATSGDPWFVINLPRPLRRGWYKFSLCGDFEGVAQPKLYFGFNGHFDEEFATRLWWDGAACSAIIRVHRPAPTLRLDPCDRPMRFNVGSFSYRPMGFGELTARRLVRVSTWWKNRKLGAGSSSAQSVRRRGLMAWRGFDAAKPTWVPVPVHSDYELWIERSDYDPEKQRSRVVAAVEALENRPRISVLMPVYNTPARFLDEAIASVVNQIYPDWELCLADDCSTEPHVKRILSKWAAKDDRIKIVFREENGRIARATNSAFELATGEWIALLDHDDVLREHALAEVALTLAQRPDAELLYSDEDKIDENGRRSDPHFKCDFSPELFRSMNYLNHLTVHRAENVRRVGGWRIGFEGSQDYDLNLRIYERASETQMVHIPKVLYHWRAVEGSTALAGGEKEYATEAARRALSEHISRAKLDAEVLAVPGTPFHRLKYAVGERPPLVSIIIPTKDHLDDLKTCLSSIVEKTDYPNYEIIVVDNASQDAATRRYLKRLAKRPRFRVLRYPHQFNFSAINNAAVRSARGEILALVNNDIEVITQSWLTEMVSWALQPRIGCVGAKLYYPDDTIQHAGVILGLGGVAGHSHKHLRRDNPGYFHRLSVAQNLSAVTGACLAVRKSVYFEVGGLDAKALTVAFNDVDLCLKVREAGYRNVWTPFAELYHHESKSRGAEDSPAKQERFAREIEAMKDRWKGELCADPFYSVHLTRNAEDFSIAR